jgi:hypothetical protein
LAETLVEVGVAPPGARFGGLGLLNGGAWTPAMREILVARYPEHPDELGRVTFELPKRRAELEALLGDLRQRGIEPVLDYHVPRNPTPARVHSVPYYLMGADRKSSAYLSGSLFEQQYSCCLPKPAPLMGHDAGCGLRKRQVKKLQLAEAGGLGLDDVVEAVVDPLTHPWQAIVVSARFRDALMASDLRGFGFLPISGPKASPEDRLIEARDCNSDLADCFQWVIFGQAKPIPISEFSLRRGPCSVCTVVIGHEEPYRFSQPLSPALFAGDADVLVSNDVVLPSGQVQSTINGSAIASSRFVEFSVREKFRGLSRLSGRAPHFTALYFGRKY